MNWTTCDTCGEEFRVIHETTAIVAYCPLCGTALEEQEDDEEEYDN